MIVKALRGWEYEENSSGSLTTGVAYSSGNTVVWECYHLSKKSIIINNTGSSYSLTYKVVLLSKKEGEEFLFKEDTINAGEQVMFALNNFYYSIKIAVKNGDGLTTCIFDYSGRLMS